MSKRDDVFDGDLTIVHSSDPTDDWWVLQRAMHDYREWLEDTGPQSKSFCTSGRLDRRVDVEGTSDEWRAIADGLESGATVAFKRCGVYWEDGIASITSPRNSCEAAWITQRAASHLAKEIRKKLEKPHD